MRARMREGEGQSGREMGREEETEERTERGGEGERRRGGGAWRVEAAVMQR